MRKVSVKEHYDLLIEEDNDPVNDPPFLQDYMNKWDGQPFIDALALKPDSNVLEIGVGTGRLAKKVQEAGCGHFTGIDLSPATIGRARENLSAWPNLSLILGDYIDHQFSRAFDIIYCSLTLFHFEDKRAFIQKVFDLLCDKGRFVLSIPKEKEYFIDMGSRKVDIFPDDLNALMALLTGSALTILEMIDVEFAHIIVSEK